MRTNQEQIDVILTRYHTYQAAKKKKRLLYTSLASAACLLLVFASALVLPNLPREAAQPNQSNGTGVWIPAIEPSAGTADMFGILVYQGRVYTQAEYLWDCDEATVKNLVGEYLGTADGTIQEGASKSGHEPEFASNMTGKVYTVQGYDKTFRLCIPSTYEGKRNLYFYEHLNGISLTTGKELFGERLHLKGNYREAVFQTHSDWDNAKNVFHPLSSRLTEAEIAEFVDALYQAPFVDLSAEFPDGDIYREKQAHLLFRMDDNTTVALRLFENGYVKYDTIGSNIWLKIDADSFSAMWNACTQA